MERAGIIIKVFRILCGNPVKRAKRDQNDLLFGRELDDVIIMLPTVNVPQDQKVIRRLREYRAIAGIFSAVAGYLLNAGPQAASSA